MGWAAFGKNAMAQALSHDDAVRRAFPDGITWVALGQKPDLLTLQNGLLRSVAPDSPPEETVAEARSRIVVFMALTSV